MPTISDVFNELVQANTRLQQVINVLDSGFVNLSQGFANLITLQNYANQALAHQADQNDTIICVLEQISRNTCNLLNEAHTQTGLQVGIRENTGTLLELFKSV